MLDQLDLDPKTLVLDNKVDVKRRLADLHEWQNDVSRRDADLAREVHQLELQKKSAPDKRQVRLIEQKQNLIGILRRRWQVLLVRTPFGVSPSAVKALGFDTIFNSFAQQYAALSQEEKLLWLNNLHFIITGDVCDLNEKLALILRRTSSGEQRNLLIGGDSGSGKTRFMEWFSAQYLAEVQEERNYVPVVLVEAIKDDKTTKSLLQSAILGCGLGYFDDDSVNHLFNKIGSAFQICGVRLVVTPMR